MHYREPGPFDFSPLPPLPKEPCSMDMEGVTLEIQEARVMELGCGDFLRRGMDATYDGEGAHGGLCRDCAYWHDDGGTGPLMCYAM